jgi:hypothetical protein
VANRPSHPHIKISQLHSGRDARFAALPERSDLPRLLWGRKVRFNVERGESGELAATNLKAE